MSLSEPDFWLPPRRPGTSPDDEELWRAVEDHKHGGGNPPHIVSGVNATSPVAPASGDPVAVPMTADLVLGGGGSSAGVEGLILLPDGWWTVTAVWYPPVGAGVGGYHILAFGSGSAELGSTYNPVATAFAREFAVAASAPVLSLGGNQQVVYVRQTSGADVAADDLSITAVRLTDTGV